MTLPRFMPMVLSLWAFLGVSVCLGGLGLAGLPAAAAPQELRVTLQLPPDSPLYESIARFKQDVEKGTGGALKVSIFPSAKLFKPSEVKDAVGKGEIEMGASLLSAYVDLLPESDIFSLPFMFTTEALRRAATLPDSPVRAPIDAAILEKTGARVLWWFPSGATIMLSRGGTPTLTPPAIAQKKVRVSSASLGEMVKACGGEPIHAGGDEQFALYKDGSVDVGMTSMSIVAPRKLWEVMDTLTITNHVQTEFILIINEKVWQSLPPDQQKLLQTAARSSEQFFRTRIEEIAREGLEHARQQGMHVFEIADADVKEWKDCATPLLATYLSRAGAAGAKVMQGYRKVLVDAYRAAPLR